MASSSSSSHQHGTTVPPNTSLPKAESLFQHTAGLYVPPRYPVPFPKNDTGHDSTRLLRETKDVIDGARVCTTKAFRKDMEQENHTAIPMLPHPSIIADDISAQAWMHKFSKVQERSLPHALESCITFVEGMPICVPCPNSRVFPVPFLSILL